MNHYGYYGKTIHRGDFVRFNLPQIFVAVWDDWWQQVLAAGESRWGASWAQHYDEAPDLCFALSTGIAGESVWCGAVQTSRDKVGRRFPFCLAARTTSSVATSVFGVERQQLDALQSLLGRVNDPAFDFDSLKPELAALAEDDTGPDASTVPAEAPDQETVPDDTIAIVAGQDALLQSAAGTQLLLDAALQQSSGPYSLWEHAASAARSGYTLIHGGLPSADNALALIDGQWQDGRVARIPDSLLQATPVALDEALPPTPARAVAAVSAEDTDVFAERAAFGDSEEIEDGIITDSSDAPTPELQDEGAESNEDLAAADPAPMSESDWSALDDFSDDAVDPPPTPDVEPLEFDDDDSGTAPWDR